MSDRIDPRLAIRNAEGEIVSMPLPDGHQDGCLPDEHRHAPGCIHVKDAPKVYHPNDVWLLVSSRIDEMTAVPLERVALREDSAGRIDAVLVYPYPIGES